MNESKHFGEPLSDDPDDAPELLPAFFADAEIRQGETVIRPGRHPTRVIPTAAPPESLPASPGKPAFDPDDEPELTTEMLRDAELFHGDTFIARGADIKRGPGEIGEGSGGVVGQGSGGVAGQDSAGGSQWNASGGGAGGRADGGNAGGMAKRGRPKSPAAKELVSVRLDPDVLAKLREAGPGWQSRISGLLRQALGMGDKPTPAPNPAP